MDENFSRGRCPFLHDGAISNSLIETQMPNCILVLNVWNMASICNKAGGM
jgi:hypothetical protein